MIELVNFVFFSDAFIYLFLCLLNNKFRSLAVFNNELRYRTSSFVS